jgi:hypothetical protein
LFFVVLASLFVLAVPGNAAAARPIAHSHEQFSDSFAIDYCGIEGTSVLRGVTNFTRYSDGTFLETVSYTEIFTATASQKSIVFRAADLFTRRSPPIDNGDGTLTFIVTFNGPVLSFDAGSVTFAHTWAANEDGTFTYLSTEILGLHGPHPEVLSDGALFCDVVVPALT